MNMNKTNKKTPFKTLPTHLVIYLFIIYYSNILFGFFLCGFSNKGKKVSCSIY